MYIYILLLYYQLDTGQCCHMQLLLERGLMSSSSCYLLMSKYIKIHHLEQQLPSSLKCLLLMHYVPSYRWRTVLVSTHIHTHSVLVIIAIVTVIVIIIIVIIVIVVIIIPQASFVGRALLPITLVVVGFQLMIHVKGQPLKALAPLIVIIITLILIMIFKLYR